MKSRMKNKEQILLEIGRTEARGSKAWAQKFVSLQILLLSGQKLVSCIKKLAKAQIVPLVQSSLKLTNDWSLKRLIFKSLVMA